MEIRAYRSEDLVACRALYAELVEHHREIYDDLSIGGDDPGSGFDEYLALPTRVLSWVATDGKEVIGLAGLLWEGDESTVEPVIVSQPHRGTGVGRALVETAIEESRRRGATDVNIMPVARNASAISAFHQLGFQKLGHVQLFLRLEEDGSDWQSGIDVHGLTFDY